MSYVCKVDSKYSLYYKTTQTNINCLPVVLLAHLIQTSCEHINKNGRFKQTIWQALNFEVVPWTENIYQNENVLLTLYDGL